MSVPGQEAAVTQEQALDDALVNSLEEMISVLEGVGPLCQDIDELIEMLNLAIKNPSQRALLRAHLAPKRMRTR